MLADTSSVSRGGRQDMTINAVENAPPEALVDANRAILERLSRGLAIRQEPTLGPLVRPSDEQEPVQRWFHYREGYTVELCRRLFSPDDTFVIDPFSGFGSTLVAARGAGLPSAGLDVSPLATFVARVKTRRYAPGVLAALRYHAARLGELSEVAPVAPAPQLRILPKLFHPEILKALLIFRAAIDTIAEPLEQDFFMLAWLATLEGLSNVYREGNGVKYRNRLRRGNFYTVRPYEQWQAEHFPEDKFAFVRREVLSRLEMMLDEAAQLSDGPEALVVQGDASNAASLAPPGGASLLLFSPPYCNCFNYIKAYKLELWMAGFIRTYPDIRALTAMGVRSRTESLLGRVTDPYPPVIEDLVGLMDLAALWSPQLPNVVRGYFADMQRTLAALNGALRPGGRCVIVVGNSAYGGVLIPSDLLLAWIAGMLGYEVEEIVITRHLTTSSQQKKLLAPIKEYLRESIIHLRKRS